jgi:hypothetical protein
MQNNIPLIAFTGETDGQGRLRFQLTHRQIAGRPANEPVYLVSRRSLSRVKLSDFMMSADQSLSNNGRYLNYAFIVYPKSTKTKIRSERTLQRQQLFLEGLVPQS